MIFFVIILFSFVVYNIAFYKLSPVFKYPSLGQITFFRDYLLLTILPYFYYYYNNRYLEHYILSQLSSVQVIKEASLHAFIFIFFFLFSYRFFYQIFKNINSKIKIRISENKMLIYLKIFSIFIIITFFIIAIKYKASIFGLLSYSLTEINFQRAFLTQSNDLSLIFVKIMIKSWIPMLSYLFFYIYLVNVNIFDRTSKFLMYLLFLIGILSSLFYFEKSVIFFYILGLVGVYIYAGNPLSKKYLLVIPFLAFLLISIMYLLTYQDRIVDNKYLIDILIHRSATQSVGSIMAIDYFSSHETLGYSGVSNFWANVLGEKFQTPYSLLIKYYVPETADTSGALSSFAAGEAYGLFGYFGLFISGIIVAFFYAFFEATKYSKFMAYIFVGLYGIYFSHFFVASGFYSFMWPVGMFYNLFPFIVIVLLSVKYKGVHK